MVEVRIGSETEQLTWEEFESRVRRGRIPPDARVRFEPVTGDGFVVAQELELFRDLRDDAAIAWQGRFNAGPPPIVTALLVGVQLRIWWFARLPGIRDLSIDRLTKWTAPTLEDGEIWRPVTMGLLHTEFQHIVLNMMWLAYTAWNLERALGWKSLLWLYFGAVTGGSLLSMFGAPGTRSLGASGGVFGLIAACVVFGFTRPEILPERGRRYFGFALLPYLLLMFLSGLRNASTDNWSHFGGLLVGTVLALLIDPPGLERRPGWNSRLRWSTTALTVALLVGLGLAGPRIYPLVDTSEAHNVLMDLPPGLGLPGSTDADRELTSAVPTGWVPASTLSSDLGFSSRVGRRTWSVQTRRHGHEADPEALRTAWLDKLSARGWDAELGPLEPSTVGGHPGFKAVGSVDWRGTPVHLEWEVATRGLWALEQIWEVDANREARLAPLLDRLRAQTRWRDPDALIDAWITVRRYPTAEDGRRSLAEALGEIGEVEQAAALWHELIEEAPHKRPYRLGLLQLISWYPRAFPAPDPEYDAALAADLGPKITLAVVTNMELDGEPELAAGLLELAWLRAPGDHILRRARQRRELPITLTATDPRPRQHTWDPIRSRIVPSTELRRWREGPVTLAGARELDELMSDRRDTLQARAVAQHASTDPGLASTLMQLREGFVPPDPAASLEALRSELADVVEGRSVPWLTAPLPAAEHLLTAMGGHTDAALLAEVPPAQP